MSLSNTRLLAVALLACAATLTITGCRSASGKPRAGSEVVRPDQVTDFATLYGQNCAGCHGASGKNGAAIALANPVYLAVAGVANIQRITANGVLGTAMPPFGKTAGGMLTDQQIAVLAAGMESIWGYPAALAGQTPPAYASSTPGDPTRGEKAFSSFCARCHGIDGTGASPVNEFKTGSLIDPAYLALISDQGLRSIILASEIRHSDMEYLKPIRHDWRSYSTTHPLTDAEITDIVAWLTSHRTATPGQPYQQHP